MSGIEWIIQENDEGMKILSSYNGDAKRVVVPEEVAFIAPEAFQGKCNIEEISLGKNVKVIRGYAFEYCTKLKSITIPESVEELALSAFYGCSNLTELTFKGSIRRIKFSEFQPCYTRAFLGNLSELSVLHLIERCPEVCYSIPDERCTEEFLDRAQYAVINGALERAKNNPDDKKSMREDEMLLRGELGNWFGSQREKNLSQMGRLMSAIGEFRDKSK